MNVFVSSVVRGFEEYRAAARRAIELVDAKPIMSEDFGARPYSSEQACITEIESSQIFVLILGERYGFEQADGISVTQQEFRHAVRMSIPILVFIQNVEMEPKQAEFRAEVEGYHSGFCRESFVSPEELKERTTQNLHRLNRAREAISEQEFERRIAAAMTKYSHWSGSRSDDAKFLFSFLPQPESDLDLREIMAGRDKEFAALASHGLVTLRDGYELIDEPDHTGLKSRETILRRYQDGLITFETPATVEAPSMSFGSWYVPPSNVRRLALACFHLIRANGGWCRIGLAGMDNPVMAELPSTPSNSFSLANRGDTEGSQRKLLIPCTQSAYGAWVDVAVARLERQFGPR